MSDLIEVESSPELRDKIFEHLPTQARSSLMGAEAKFWPTQHGEMELRIKYDATDDLLDIDAVEGIYGPDEKLAGSYVRGCELHSVTGEIHAYSEYMVSPGKTTPIDQSLLGTETDCLRFDVNKLDFLLALFDSL